MPHDIQEQMVHSLPGLEQAKILKYAYAIEYDAIYPTQLKQTLETKIIKNLYTAGQINAGIDIINTLSEYFELVAPIFIDNSECVNKIADAKGQLIKLVVTEDKEIKINE